MAGARTDETWTFSPEDRELGDTLRADPTDDVELGMPEDDLVLGEVIGEGGMGVVSLGAQGRLRREVAVKQLKPGVPPKVAQSLMREAWVTGALEHPNVVPVHDLLVDDDGNPQIVLKRIEGTAWEAYLEGARELPEEAEDDPVAWHLRVLMQVCNAVDFAHQKGVVHRDLKPENVMIGAFGEVYVLDWGIAMGLRPDPKGRFPLAADQRGMVGTPLYMAPEMFVRDVTKLGEGTDVYLLAGLLYRVLSGRPPRDGDTLAEIVARSRSMPVMEEAWPLDLRELMKACFDLDPDERPSASDFRRALRAHLDRRGLDKLFRASESKLATLRQLVEEAHPEDPDQLHLEVHDTVGAVRFGLREVIEGWPTHPSAASALREAYELMVRYELKRGQGRAAHVWLLRLDAPPTELTEAVDAQLEREKDDKERLERLTRDLDRGTGLFTRMFLFVLLAAAWVGFPFVASLLGWSVDYPRSGIQYAAVFVLLLPVGLLGPVRASRTNRGFWTLAMLSAVFTLIALLLGWRWELDIAHTLQLKALCDAALVMVATLLFEILLLPAAVFYLVVVFTGIFYPEWIYLLARLATAFLVFNGLAAWPFARRR